MMRLTNSQIVRTIPMLFTLLLLCSFAQGKIIYVDADATGDDNGTSWTDAYNFLQDALAEAVSGDEIHVAQGTYTPDQGVEMMPGDRSATFQLKDGVVLKGGYGGATILSGDLEGNDGPGFANYGDNSYHVVTSYDCGAITILDGFIVTGGEDNGAPDEDKNGGGMHNRYSDPTVINCTFVANKALEGGGMYNYSSSPTIRGCLFKGNYGHRSGGGMFNMQDSSPELSDCTFGENWAAYGAGGGMVNQDDSSPTLTGCAFKGNSASDRGGGMHNLNFSSPELENCTFDGNGGGDGGGMCNTNRSDPILVSCTFSSNRATWNVSWGSGGGMCNTGSSPALIECTFTGNWAGIQGGGMLNVKDETALVESRPTLTNCTFSYNRADRLGGAMGNSKCILTLSGCIFLGNSAGQGGGAMYSGASSLAITGCGFGGNDAELAGGAIADTSNRDSTWLNCVFAGNSADAGGGLHDYDGSPTLVNCVFTENWARYGAGICKVWAGNPTVTNCTFAGNSADLGATYELDVGDSTLTNCVLWDASPVEIHPGTGRLAITYSDIRGGWAAGGNIDIDPMFADTAGRLLPASPCVDAGSNAAVPPCVTIDFDGKPRIQGPAVDMGAYESLKQTPIQAVLDVDPDVINLGSTGKWITCYIELLEGYEVAKILGATVVLNGISAYSGKEGWAGSEAHPSNTTDHDRDGIPERMVKFLRSQVEGVLVPGQAELIVRGQLADGTNFEGTETIRVMGN